MFSLFSSQSINALVLFIAGLFAGWFLTLLVWRWPQGIRLLSPRSLCPRCGTPIQSRDLLPVVSYFALQGKCRACEGLIHPRYPLTELSTAILWGWCGWMFADLPYHPVVVAALGILVLAFGTAMIAIALLDWDTRTIPDAITHTGILVALLAAPIFPELHHAETADEFSRYHPFLSYILPDQQPWQHGMAATVVGALTGFGFSMLVYVVGNALFRKQIERSKVDSALGIGDIKLMTFIGAFLGWESVFTVFAIGAIAGALVGSVCKLRSGDPGDRTGWGRLRARWGSGGSVLPFGPFLAAGALFALIRTLYTMG